MSRSLHITGAATVGIFIAIGKLIMGVLSLSFFTYENVFYSFGMIGAKSIALTGIRKAQSKREQYQYYFCSGVVLIGFYMICRVKKLKKQYDLLIKGW